MPSFLTFRSVQLIDEGTPADPVVFQELLHSQQMSCPAQVFEVLKRDQGKQLLCIRFGKAVDHFGIAVLAEDQRSQLHAAVFEFAEQVHITFIVNIESAVFHLSFLLFFSHGVCHEAG